MSMLYLDNDVLAKFARPNPDPVVVEYLQGRHAEPWGISSLVAYEFLSFYPQSQRGEKLRQLEQDVLNEISPIDTRTSLQAATLRSLLENAGTALDTGDLFVAATVRRHGGTLATANANDFDKQPIHELLDVEIVPTDA
ncbi:plasmid stability protein StbB [Halorhabdus tiamatea SARL4B]|uniref:Plasmid stability protein StbB n=2 Tax=Halorhabdus tiamatea SARL4B TaxID=1033806 RepID=S6D030_9EURY|nr:plasmid stability protein StbB [Halorhabdus tiamatea SARL4B]